MEDEVAVLEGIHPPGGSARRGSANRAGCQEAVPRSPSQSPGLEPVRSSSDSLPDLIISAGMRWEAHRSSTMRLGYARCCSTVHTVLRNQAGRAAVGGFPFGLLLPCSTGR